MQTWPLTGRAEELEVIADVLGADGPHAGVVIVGSAGVGKTRLAREAMAAASRRGMVVRWLAGTLAAQSVPLGACVQWAERLGGNPVQLVGRAIKAITASPDDSRVLVIVDDAHLLDNLSAFVLHQLVPRRAAAGRGDGPVEGRTPAPAGSATALAHGIRWFAAVGARWAGEHRMLRPDVADDPRQRLVPAPPGRPGNARRTPESP